MDFEQAAERAGTSARTLAERSRPPTIEFFQQTMGPRRARAAIGLSVFIVTVGILGGVAVWRNAAPFPVVSSAPDTPGRATSPPTAASLEESPLSAITAPTTTLGPVLVTRIETGQVFLDETTPLAISDLNVTVGQGLVAVEISNTTDRAISLSGWRVEDVTPPTHSFSLPALDVDPGTPLTVWYGTASNEVCDIADTARTVYWCSRDPDGDGHTFTPWYSFGDTALLLDPDGVVRSSWTYSAIRERG